MGLGTSKRCKSISSLLAEFTPKQLEAFNAVCKYDYVLYGGARGGAKSWFLRWCAAALCIYWGKVKGIRGVRVGLFCESYPTLKDRQISKIATEFPRWLGELKDTKEDGLCFHMMQSIGGGKIVLRNLDDPAKYKSAEFAAEFVDQLEENTIDTFNILRASKRWPGIDHTKFVAGANPGGVGHGWVKRFWLDGDFPPEMSEIAKQFHFVRALPTDNPHLSKEYWLELNSLPPALKKAWVDGDWNIFEGQAFTAWRDHLHVIEKPFDIPSSWPKWRAVDWGKVKPFCCLWFAKDPDIGRVYVYREVYEIDLTDKQQATMIKDNTPNNERINLTFADPSMWEEKDKDSIRYTTASEYSTYGVSLTKANNDRMAGKRKVDRLLMNLPDGKPAFQVFPSCVNFIRTFPYLPYDKHNVEDIDTNAEDHAYDTFRYGLSNYRDPEEKPKQDKTAQDFMKFKEAMKF